MGASVSAPALRSGRPSPPCSPLPLRSPSPATRIGTQTESVAYRKADNTRWCPAGGGRSSPPGRLVLSVNLVAARPVSIAAARLTPKSGAADQVIPPPIGATVWSPAERRGRSERQRRHVLRL
jgi:hypothetical protein